MGVRCSRSLDVYVIPMRHSWRSWRRTIDHLLLASGVFVEHYATNTQQSTNAENTAALQLQLLEGGVPVALPLSVSPLTHVVQTQLGDRHVQLERVDVHLMVEHVQLHQVQQQRHLVARQEVPLQLRPVRPPLGSAGMLARMTSIRSAFSAFALFSSKDSVEAFFGAASGTVSAVSSKGPKNWGVSEACAS